MSQGFLVTQAGALSLLQDSGRFGAFNLGLTNGGPIDYPAFYWANKLCGNDFSNNNDFTSIEVTFGGFEITCQIHSVISVTGATAELKINNIPHQLWQSYVVKPGDIISLGYPTEGIRNYIAVYGGFTITPSFGSTATVCREKIGGLNGGKLANGDKLPCKIGETKSEYSSQLILNQWSLNQRYWPIYQKSITLRTVAGYQHHQFSTVQQQLFYTSEYEVSNAFDRMGYRLQGQKILTNTQQMLSEGICHGAVQIPADGQPIVLLNDRQTIGGYPKIGAVIAADTAKLGQLTQGAKVSFTQISSEEAHNIFHLTLARHKNIELTSKT